MSPNIDPSKSHTLPASAQVAAKLKVSVKKPTIDPMAPSIAIFIFVLRVEGNF